MAERSVLVPTQDGKTMPGLWRGATDCPVVVLVHGLTSNMNEHIHYNGARFFEEGGFAVLRFNLYDAGPDCRKLSESTLDTHARDIEAAVRFARSQAPGQKIAVVAHSLGGLALLLTKEPIDVSVLWDPTHPPGVKPLEAVEDVAELGLYRWPLGVDYLLNKEMIDAIQALDGDQLIADWHYPVKIVSASSGTRTELGERYFRAANKPKSFATVVDSDHTFSNDGNDIDLFGATYLWLEQYCH